MENNKQTIRLTESQLNKIIKESVKNILTELDWRTAKAAAKAAGDKSFYSDNEYDSERRMKQSNKFHEYARKKYNTQYGLPADLKNNWKERNKEAKEMKNSKDWEYDPATNKARLLRNGKPVEYDWWQDVPKEFHPTQGQLKKLSQRHNDTQNFDNKKSEYRNGKWRTKDVLDKDEPGYLESHSYKKQPSTLNKAWEDVLNYDYNV